MFKTVYDVRDSSNLTGLLLVRGDFSRLFGARLRGPNVRRGRQYISSLQRRHRLSLRGDSG